MAKVSPLDWHYLAQSTKWNASDLPSRLFHLTGILGSRRDNNFQGFNQQRHPIKSVVFVCRALGWRLGLQVVTGAISVTFILGTFYRSASLYHPQRRAILHIKNQKRKIKDKNKIEDKIPFFDFSTLKSKTVRILLISTGISAFGINTPLFYLAYQAEVEGLGDSTVFLQMYLGLAWTVGCVVFSTLVLHNSTECRIARQYLCQTAVFMCGLSILAFTVVSGNYHAYVMFAWIYGEGLFQPYLRCSTATS
jgi:hypothetical protein